MDPLVLTKVRPSQPRPKLVARPRLVEGLNREQGRRLTLISAPAGFGKTTLLVKWAKDRVQQGSAVAWLSLDEGDGDPVRFLSYLVAALKEGIGEREFGEGVLAALRAPGPPRFEALIAALVNEMTAISGGLDIVLDDYHLVGSGEVHEIVTALLDHMPENVHLVLSGRVDPPLALARLRARNHMVKLGASELAFTREEAVAFLRGIMELDLSDEDVARLDERTEGWIAGLQLAALSMRDHSDLPAFVESFSGTHRDVLDFLVDEVLDRQPEKVRRFLLETSILATLSGPLCDALTGRADGNEMLERLEMGNLFVVALDDERVWYRYHHLFAEFLRGRLRRENPDLKSELHLRASVWYEKGGRLSEAIEHALSASDHELAARLIGAGSGQAWSRGEVPTVLRWLEALPNEAKRRRPRLLLQHAMALALTGSPDAAEDLINEVDQGAGAIGEDIRFLSGFASAVRSWCARLRGDAHQAVKLARRGLSLLPEEEGGLRAFAAVVLGDALWTTGDLAAADEALEEAARIGRSAGHVYSTLSALTLAVRVQSERGRLRDAGETLHRARRYVEEQEIDLLPAVGAIHIMTGALLYERDDLDGAESALELGVGMAGRTGNVTDLVWGHVVLSRARWARGDVRGARDEACKANRVARDYGAGLEIAIAAAWMMRLCLMNGDLAEAAVLDQELVASAEGAADAAAAVDQITSARLLHARGRHREALRLLARLLETARTQGMRIAILILQALALRAMGEAEQAVNTLMEALAMAEPEDYVRTFVDEGPPMAKLLSTALGVHQRRHLHTPVSVHYLRKLLAATERYAAGATLPTADLPDPVSGRELEVLQLVATGKSNRQLATELFVSVGTVKTHLNNLYRKLGVHSRTQAVARARELGLL